MTYTPRADWQMATKMSFLARTGVYTVQNQSLNSISKDLIMHTVLWSHVKLLLQSMSKSNTEIIDYNLFTKGIHFFQSQCTG